MCEGHVDGGGIPQDLERDEVEAVSSGRVPVCLCCAANIAYTPPRRSGLIKLLLLGSYQAISLNVVHD